MKNAYEFKAVYDTLGVNLNTLGCLMLETEKPKIELTGAIPYVSPDPEKFWINGILDDAHVTVRYGFMPEVKATHINEVLRSVFKPSYVTIFDLEMFPSPFPDTEPYECIVGLVSSWDLTTANVQLGVLPNVATYPIYKPHVTIGYVEKGWWDETGYKLNLDSISVKCGDWLMGKTLR